LGVVKSRSETKTTHWAWLKVVVKRRPRIGRG